MKKLLQSVGHLSASITLILSGPVFAALPTTAAPTRGNTAGSFLTNLQNYAYDIGIFAGLAIATIVFFIVAKNVMATYSLVPEGRATMGQVGVQAIVGSLLLVFVVYLATEAANIL